MEFIEAPVFSRYLPDYLGDENYRALQEELAVNPGPEAFVSSAGLTRGVAKAAEVVSGSSTTTLSLNIRYGS
jgi:hypothetical protein